MEKVNYIIHLNEAFERFNRDEKIKQGHITLYLAFFQKWNREFFKETITISRERIMDMAKFRSKTTYHNYLKDLNDWGFLQYFPSYNPARGSKVKMTKFCTSSGQSIDTGCGTSSGQNLNTYVPKPGQNLVPFNKHKTKKNLNKGERPKNELVVLEFFKKNHWPEMEAKKFYAFLQSKNWKYENGLNVKNWKALAHNFFKNDFQKIETYNTSPIFGYVTKLGERINY